MEIVPGVHRVPGVRGGNVYLILGQRAALIDSGFSGNEAAVTAYLDELGVPLAHLTVLLATHRHGDHTGSLRQLRRATGADVAAHQSDAVLRWQPNTGPSPARRWTAKWAGKLVGRTVADRFVNDGAVFDEHRGLTALHTPGHTPGSLCFWLPEERVLFTGDTVLSHGDRLSRPLSAPGPHNALLEQSLTRLVALEPAVVASGHGAPVMDGASTLLRTLAARRPDALALRLLKNWRRLFRFSRDLGRPLE
ncbi:MAG: MBL fold metallo-hydrolase [Chloroflexi bacterium]|nr:MBL fold metallo-hydrolase [Chloroflexota bacterium]